MLPAGHPFGTAINIASGHIFRVSMCSTWSIVVIFSVFFVRFLDAWSTYCSHHLHKHHVPTARATCSIDVTCEWFGFSYDEEKKYVHLISNTRSRHTRAPPHGRGAKQCFKLLLSLFGERKKLHIPLSLSRCTIIYLFSQSRDRPLSAANGFQFRNGENT